MIYTDNIKHFTPSDFLWNEIAHALARAGVNVHPWVEIDMVKGSAKRTPEGFIRWTMSVYEGRTTGYSAHKDWAETGDKPFKMEVLQQEWNPFAVRITIKGNRMTIASF